MFSLQSSKSFNTQRKCFCFFTKIFTLRHVHAYGLYNICLLGSEVMIDIKENLIQKTELRLRFLTHCQNTAVSICDLWPHCCKRAKDIILKNKILMLTLTETEASLWCMFAWLHMDAFAKCMNVALCFLGFFCDSVGNKKHKPKNSLLDQKVWPLLVCTAMREILLCSKLHAFVLNT